MAETISQFVVNELYSHEEIYRSLGVGNAGGVRFLLNGDGTTRRGVLFTAVAGSKLESENPYYDRVEKDVLIYTAQGRHGEQGFGGQNQRLLSHGDDLFPLYCFQLICSRRDKTVGVRRWRFLGLLFGVRRYKERQVDVTGQIRTACIFEFAVLSSFGRVIVEDDVFLANSLYRDYAERNFSAFSQEEENAKVADEIKSNMYTPEELERTRFAMLSLHPQKFEELIQKVLERSGYSKVCTTQYSQDGGIDVDAYASEDNWPIRDLHLQIQAKRWMHTVGRKEVAELRGSLAQYARGAIVTTSQFSKAALLEATEEGKMPIVTLDGYDFANIVKRYDIAL